MSSVWEEYGMKAVMVSSFGSADVLDLVELADPCPGPGQVLISVQAAGVGFMDVMVRNGTYPQLTEPGVVPGAEVAGIVTAVGDGVGQEWLGRRVFALTVSSGYAELVTVGVDHVVALPEAISAPDAVALGVNALVASLGLKRVAVQPGERVLVRGAGGGIGMMAAQLATAAGAEVTAITSTPQRVDRLRQLGVAHVLDRRAGQDGGDSSYDVVIDPVGGAEITRYIELLRPNGRFLSCGAAGGVPGPDAFAGLLTTFHNSPTVFAFNVSSVGPGAIATEFADLLRRTADGALRVVVDTELPLSEVVKAHTLLESGTVFGKLVLVP
ncbi:quinone oxidoreductase family protein [Saccharopolyspora shandongensis]|nr:zinc-binding dehydrogenase [Saccharopolyspora shandongensis]